ncbi:MAG: hypothetical protein JSR59_11690 [Proteobacteria bacterium]|nr:hypothetical protein [Pseudomonadota bacterium]
MKLLGDMNLSPRWINLLTGAVDAETQVLRIGSKGRWEASEFAQSLSALDRLYTLRFGLALEGRN